MRILNFDQFNDEIGLAATLSFKFGPGWSIVRKRGHPRLLEFGDNVEPEIPSELHSLHKSCQGSEIME